MKNAAASSSDRENQRVFSEENPYGEQPRKNSLKQPKKSLFEKYDEIRYQCYQVEEKVQDLANTIDMVHYDHNQECVQIPVELFERMKGFTQQIQSEFKNVQGQWTDFFDQQQEDNLKYRDKSKTYKKKLKGLENQSILFMRDQKELEKSLVDITKEHDINKDKMGLVLDQMESQVSELKNTRQNLNLKYESQLDKAVKEMINFYNNLEADGDDFDIDSVNIDKVFFIKPTHEINLRLQNSQSECHKTDGKLKLNPQGSSELERHQGATQKATTGPQQRAAIPRIPMEKLNQKKVDSPKIMKAPSPPPVEPQPTEADQFVTNPVILGAVVQESKFDKQYEDDYDCANVTLDMNTSRLAQFPEEYEMLQHIQDPDQRIIMKQIVFMRHERQLKKQAKQERKRLKKLKKMQEEQKNSGEKTNRSLVPTPTNRSGLTKFGQKKSMFGNMSSKSSKKELTLSNGLKFGMKQVNDANEYTGMVTSRFSMHSELPSIDTIEQISAQKKFKPQDVNHSEIINCEQELVHGLQSATQKSLIRKIEEEFKQKEMIREQLKDEEKKLNYSSSTQSKVSLLGKQVSQGSLNSKAGLHMLSDLQRQYASNNSQTNSNPKLIQVDSEYSMNSDPKQMKNGIKCKQMIDNLNVEVNLDGNCLVDGQLPHQIFSEFDPQNISQITPSDLQKKVLDPEKIDESFLSGNSQYQRIFDPHQESESRCLSGGYPSPLQIQNSYIQSSNQSAEEKAPHQIDQQEMQQQEPQQMVNRIDDDIKNIRKRLPLDVIQERQSEFSQSMMTNAARLNSHRSRQNNHYHNMSKITQNGNLPTGRSEVNNKSSSRIKDRPPLGEMEDYRSYNCRSITQAQTSRNNEKNSRNYLVDNTISKNKNKLGSVSKSSKDFAEHKNIALKKQPSAGKIENQNRQRYLQNFESDMAEMMPSFNMQKAPAGPSSHVGKSRSFQKQHNNYVNLTQQNSQLNSDREHHQQYQPHSHRSHVGGGESLRDRSYFDESPAIFDNADSATRNDGSDRWLRNQHGINRSSAAQHYLTEIDQSTNMYHESQNLNTGILQMQSIPQSSANSATRGFQESKKKVTEEQKKPSGLMIRSNSECQLRDKEFYEMCDEEDEIAMFCKFAEQNVLDNMHIRNLSAQYHSKNVHNQSSDNQTQLFPSNANKSNQLVFLSYRTFNRLNGLTRGKLPFRYDPTRLLQSAANGPQANLTNLLATNSLDAATTLMMHNQIMMPTHQYNRRTLLMMQNLHNNYLYSANSGILFTMQRGWNSGNHMAPNSHGASTNPQIGIGINFKNLTNLGVDNKNSSIGVNTTEGPGGGVQNDNMNSLGGDPVNISSLLMGAKQQTSEQINVGCVTIVDDDGKFLMDRKMLMEANNSSHQTNARKLFSMSRNIYGQQTTSDFSNLQTKQLGIFRNNLRPQVIANSRNLVDQVDSQNSRKVQSISESYEQVEMSERQKKKTENQNRIMNLITGLKQIQQKQQQNRPSSDLSTEPKKLAVNRIISAQGVVDLDNSQSNLTTAKTQAKRGITAGGQQTLKNMIKHQQKQNLMNLSQSIQLNPDTLSQKQQVLAGNMKTQKSIVKLKSKSQPKNGNLVTESTQQQLMQNSSDLSSISKKNKLKLVSNIKNFNTIANNSEQTLKQAQALRQQQNYTTVAQPSQKPLNTFINKKNSYQSGYSQKSARQSQMAAALFNGKLNIKKKVLNQQISMPNHI